MSNYDVVSGIMKFEGGDATDEEVLELFQHLVNTGQAWSLQGVYGRIATSLIDQGLITAPEKESDVPQG